MQKYQKKNGTVVVEACQVSMETVDKIANWAQAQIVEEQDAIHGEASEGLNIKTPAGKVRASAGAFVVKTGDNFYVIAPGLFEKQYSMIEPIEPQQRATRAMEEPPLTSDPFAGMTRFSEGPKP